MLYKIRCNLMHPLNGALHRPYVPVQARSALVTQQYACMPPCSRTSQYHRTFIPLSVSLWKDLADPVFDGVGLVSFKSRANVFFIGLSCSILQQSSTIFPFLFFLSIGGYCRAGVFGLTGCISLSLSLHCRPLLIIIIILWKHLLKQFDKIQWWNTLTKYWNTLKHAESHQITIEHT